MSILAEPSRGEGISQSWVGVCRGLIGRRKSVWEVGKIKEEVALGSGTIQRVYGRDQIRSVASQT
jgi:hypothetical protein